MERRNQPFTRIQNTAQVLTHGQVGVREDALRIIDAGILAADPGLGTRRLVHLDGDTLHIGEKSLQLGDIEHIYVIGSGKGSFPIAQVLDEILGPRITQGFVVVKRGERRRLKHIEVMEAGHPIPDSSSIEAAQKMLKIADQAGERDLVLAAITGGTSSLVTLPPEGIRLEEIQHTTDLLLKAGADIADINTVRRHLCMVKGGRLVARAHPAETITFTLRTRFKNMPWPDICLADPSTFEDAIEVLNQRTLWKKVSPTIQTYLKEGTTRPELETVKSIDGLRTSIFSVGDPQIACEAAARKAEELGYHPIILSTQMNGESAEVGRFLAGITNEIVQYGRPFIRPCAMISGGEMTTTVAEAKGHGGPNQEMVLRFALDLMQQSEVACVSVDTDGTDGPTELAGGIVDGLTERRAAALDLNIEAHILAHNTAPALLHLEDAIITGHTGTNVLNLRAVVIR